MVQPDADDCEPATELEAELADVRGIRPPAIGDAKDAQVLAVEAESRGDLPLSD